jgi:hypothetical protein
VPYLEALHVFEPAAALREIGQAPDSLRPFRVLELTVPNHAKAIRPPPSDPRPKNKLLASLPRADFERVRPLLKTIPLKVKQILHPINESVREVFFLNGGVASMTTVMRDGSMVEIATVGDEGLVGINAFFGGQMLSGETMLQVPDTNAEVMSVESFTRELARDGPFHECVHRYSQGLLMADDAVHRLYGVASGTGALLSLAVDDPRSRPTR